MSDETTLAETPGDEQIVNLDQSETPPVEGGVQTETKDEAEKPETAGDDAGEEGQSGDDKPKKLPGSRRERLRNEHLRREIEELRVYKEANERRQQAGGGDDREPQESDFNGDIFKFEREWNSWNARKIVREERERDHQSRNQHAQVDQWRERVLEHQDRVEDARSEIDDYDKVLAAAKTPVSDAVARELLLSDKSALLSYYLAKNPEKLETLNRMTGHELAREIGRLEGAVRMPPKNTKTNAPAPISQLKGGASPAFDPKTASMDDYIAKRRSGWSG